MTKNVDQNETSARREFLKTGAAAAAGVTLVGPIVGVAASEVAQAKSQIANAIQPFGMKYGGPLTIALSKLFTYDMLYDSAGVLKTGPGTTIGSYREFNRTVGYGAASYGQWTKSLLDPQNNKGSWQDGFGKPITPNEFRADAQKIESSVREALTSALKANLDSERPLPVFFFAGTSGMNRKDDPTGKNGYRSIVAQGVGFDAKYPKQTYLVLGTLCPLDA